ncbi:hypothetical protein, partial [Burkholderia sp. TSV86]|uniref:hypothetical protein n=1 Tax=Burkholderia sp. TSV86 TaxID=1385594 RepID=UPI001E2A949F
TLEIRDFIKLSTVITQMNEQLLKAQDSLFAHNTQLLQLQSEHFETAQKLRDANEALAKRTRYELVALGNGVLAYRLNPVPAQSGTTEPVTTEPEHFACQICYDAPVSRLVVLQRTDTHGNLHCPVCNTRFTVNRAARRKLNPARRRWSATSWGD